MRAERSTERRMVEGASPGFQAGDSNWQWQTCLRGLSHDTGASKERKKRVKKAIGGRMAASPSQ